MLTAVIPNVSAAALAVTRLAGVIRWLAVRWVPVPA
jgi:hypothetical protein